MQHDQDAAGRGPTVPRPPSMRPLGVLAVLPAFVALALSWTYWWSPWAILLSLLGLGVGLVARTDPATRALGTAATAMSVTAAVVSVLSLVLT